MEIAAAAAELLINVRREESSVIEWDSPQRLSAFRITTQGQFSRVPFFAVHGPTPPLFNSKIMEQGYTV